MEYLIENQIVILFAILGLVVYRLLKTVVAKVGKAARHQRLLTKAVKRKQARSAAKVEHNKRAVNDPNCIWRNCK